MTRDLVQRDAPTRFAHIIDPVHTDDCFEHQGIANKHPLPLQDEYDEKRQLVFTRVVTPPSGVRCSCFRCSCKIDLWAHSALIRGALAQRRKTPSPFFSLEQGMGELIAALETSVRKVGGNIIVGAPINSVAPPMKRLSGRWTLRFASTNSAEEVLTVDGIVMTTPAHVASTDEELVTVGREELARLLDVRAEPLFMRVFRYDQASAQLIVRHVGQVKRIPKHAERHTALWFVCAAFDGVGIPD